MRGQMIAKACAAVLFSFGLAACGGGGSGFSLTASGASSSGSSSSSSSSSSGGTGTGSGSSSGTTSQTPAHLIVITSSSTLSSNAAAGTAGASVTLTATLTDTNNVSIPNYPVTFAASAGVLVPSATTTDVDGNITATLSAGAAIAGTTINGTAAATGTTLSATTAVTVASTTPSYSLGVLSSTGSFTANIIAVGQTPLAAGGSSGLQLSIVDTANGNTPYAGSATVSFSSPCQSQGLAQITSPVTSSTGTFSTTYKATGCSGNDTITATAVVGTTSLSASGVINVQPATLGSIVFVSATPTTIGLQGTGLTDSSTVVFTVFDSNGNPVQNQQVNFSLTTTAGGVSVSPANAKSDANGDVQTTVESGTVHTTVRVTAVINGTSLTTESSQLTISTGVPTQNGFSLSATVLNLVGNNYDGNTTTITARLADRYANPVPDGTAIAFTTECGSIQPSCNTTGGLGACSVTFTTQNPRTSMLAFPKTTTTPASPTYIDNNCSATGSSTFNGGLGCDDHRCTVTAYAIGEESFNDCNGTGNYVSVKNTSNNATQCKDGDFFVSLPEVFFDYNESGVFNGDFESYVDYNHNGKYDSASSLFVGLLCNDPACDPNQTELEVSGQLVIVMTDSNLHLYVNNTNPAVGTPINPYKFVAPPSVAGLSIALVKTQIVYASVGDSQLQVPAAGTTISASMSNGGSVEAPSSYTVPNTDQFGYVTASFTIQAPTSSTSCTDTLVITATTPAYGSNAAAASPATIPVAYTGGTCPP